MIDATGTYNFGSVFGYQNNTITRYRQNFGTSSDVKNTYWALFLNDEAKLFPNVTLSYGLRYEKEKVLADNNNFGPRFGVAWDPFKKGKGVIRAGAGIFYNRTLLRTIGDLIQKSNGQEFFDTNRIPVRVTGSTLNPRTLALAAIANGFPNSYANSQSLRNTLASVLSPFGINVNDLNTTRAGFTSNGALERSYDPDLKIPESYQFNVGFEREIGNGLVFEVNYTWNKTVHLWHEYNNNAPILPAGNADWTEYLRTHTFVITNANGTTTRTYSFVLGTNTTDTVTGCSLSATSSCVVNLNSASTTNTAPTAELTATGASGGQTGSPIGVALAAITQFRPDSRFEQGERVTSGGNAKYQGLVLELRSRYRKLGFGFGSSLRGVYTLSTTKDDTLNNTTDAEANNNYAREWSRSLQDRRHRIAITGSFDTPNWLGKLKFSPIFRFGTSAPFNIGAGGADRNLDDVSNDRVNFSGNVKDIKWQKHGSALSQSFYSQFTLQPIGAKSGNLGRNAGHGPSFYLFDLSVTREFKFGERTKLRPTIQFDNILNAAVFSYGSGFINLESTNLASNTTFLVPTRTYRPREIRLGLRFDF